MNSKMVVASVLLALAACSPARADGGLAYEENKLNFVNCKNEKVTARWYGAGLSVSNAGTSPSDVATSIDYLSWDGTCQKLSWNEGRAVFVLGTGDTAKFSSVVRYKAWDGAYWVATRTGHGFYVSRVGIADAAPSAADFAAAAHWIRRSDPSNFGAMALVAHLTEGEAETVKTP